MKLTVLIPAFNPNGHLKPMLEALEAQADHFPDLEVIVGDDGSEEDVSFAKNYPHVKYFRQENGGEGKIRNALLDRASGEYIQWLDSDDRIYDNCLSIIFDNIEKGFDYVSYNWLCNGTRGGAWQNWSSHVVNCAVWAYTFRREYLGNARFREDMPTGADTEYLNRVLKAEDRHWHDERVFYNYLWDENPNSLCHRKQRGEL